MSPWPDTHFFHISPFPELKMVQWVISRPEALNALNSQVLTELAMLIQDMAQRSEINTVIIVGEGKAFVAGADIAEMSGLNKEQGRLFSEKGQKVFRSLEKLPQVIIAAINGFALGGGLELALACDIRIASQKAVMGQPEVNLGLIPGFGGTQRLAKIVGYNWSKFLILTGEQINAEKAHEIGLVSEVSEPEGLLDRASQIAKTLAKKGPKALNAAKIALESSFYASIADGMTVEAEAFGKLFPANNQDEYNEVVEGTKAFLEKRKADFQPRR